MENVKTTTAESTAISVSPEGKKIAIISYLTVIGLIIAFIMNNDKKDPYGSYHIRQAVGLAVTGLVMGVIGMIPILGWLIVIIGSFVLLYMWIMGLVNAINEKEKPVPLLGKKYEEWFRSL